MLNKTEHKKLLVKLVAAKSNEVVGLVRATRTQEEAKYFKYLESSLKEIKSARNKRRDIAIQIKELKEQIAILEDDDLALYVEIERIVHTKVERVLNKVGERKEYEDKLIDFFK